MLNFVIKFELTYLTSPKISDPLKSLLKALYKGGVDFLSVNKRTLYNSFFIKS